MIDSFSELLPFTGHGDARVGPLRWAHVAAAATLLQAAVGLAVLLRPGRLDLRRAIEVGGALAFVLVAQFVLLGRLPQPHLSSFGIAGLFWYVLCLVVPLLGLATLLARRRGRETTPVARLLALSCFATAALCAWMHFFEPKRLIVEEVRLAVAAEREGAASVRLVVFADLQNDHVGSFEREAAKAAIALQPDAILIPGDLFQGTWRDFKVARADFVELVRELSAAAPTYFVPGDTDHADGLPAFCAESGAILLDSGAATLRVKDRVLTIGGVAPLHRDPPGAGAESRRAFLKGFESAPGEADVRVLVVHHGEYVRELGPRSRVDVVVAGHTHGGQVVLPFFGPPVTASYLPRHVAYGGLFERFEGRTALYQSRGLGLERLTAPEIRLLCPPTIGLLILEDAAPAP